MAQTNAPSLPLSKVGSDAASPRLVENLGAVEEARDQEVPIQELGGVEGEDEAESAGEGPDGHVAERPDEILVEPVCRKRGDRQASRDHPPEQADEPADRVMRPFPR